MAVEGLELFRDNRDRLWIVERDDFGYVVKKVLTTPVKSYQRKWQAVEAIREGEVED